MRWVWSAIGLAMAGVMAPAQDGTVLREERKPENWTAYTFTTFEDYHMKTGYTKIFRYSDPLKMEGTILVQPIDPNQTCFKVRLELSRIEYTSDTGSWTIDFSDPNWKRKLGEVTTLLGKFYVKIHKALNWRLPQPDIILPWTTSADLQYAAVQIASTWHGSEMTVTRSEGGYKLVADHAPGMTKLQELPSSHRVQPLYEFYLAQMSKLVLPPIVKSPSKEEWKKNAITYSAWSNGTELMLTGRYSMRGHTVIDNDLPFDHVKGFGWTGLSKSLDTRLIQDLSESREALAAVPLARRETVTNRQFTIGAYADGRGSLDYVEEYAIGMTGLPNSSCVAASVTSTHQSFLMFAWEAGLTGKVDYDLKFEARAQVLESRKP